MGPNVNNLANLSYKKEHPESRRWGVQESKKDTTINGI